MATYDASLPSSDLALTIMNLSECYEERQKIGQTFLERDDREAAIKAMTALIQAAFKREPRLFEVNLKAAAVVRLAAEDVLGQVTNDLKDELASQNNAQQGNTTDRLGKAIELGQEIDKLLANIASVLPEIDLIDELDQSGNRKTLAESRNNNSSAATPPTMYASFTIPMRAIDADVLAVFRECRVENGMVYLPKMQLERKLYTKVNDVLAAMGGKWKGGKTMAHVFAEVDPEPFAECFAEMVATGKYTDPNDLGYFPTPSELVAQLIKMANLEPGMSVMEPSAGRGAIALQAAAIVGKDNVRCIEMFNPNARALEAQGFKVLEQDFLSIEPPELEEDKLDCVIMNPPFAKMQDIAHVQHACRFLKSTGRLVAITSPAWQTHATSKATAFRNFMEGAQGDVIEVASGAFKQSGTMVATRILAIDAENLPWHQEESENEAVTMAPAP